MLTARTLPFLSGQICFLVVAVTLCCQLVLPNAGYAQNTPNNDTSTKAQEVVDRAVEAFGGSVFLQSINDVELKLSGYWTNMLYQTRNPEILMDFEPFYMGVALQKEEGNYTYSMRRDDGKTGSALNGNNTNPFFYGVHLHIF